MIDARPTTAPNRRRVILFYYRPISHNGHGETYYVHQLLRSFESKGVVQLIAPKSPGPVGDSNAYMTMIRNLFATSVAQIQFLFRRGRSSVHECLWIVVDAYAAPIPIVSSRVLGIPLVYVASDPIDAYAQSLQHASIPGGFLLRLFRKPPESLLFRVSRMVIVRSRWMGDRLIEEGLPRDKLRVLSHPAQAKPPELPAISKVFYELDLSGKCGVLFLADFAYPPNREAADFLVSSVLPELRSSAPETRVIFAGPGSQRYSDPSLKQLITLGRLDDISPVAYACCIGIAPSVVSGGTSAKTVDYLAHGLKCLVTPQVARTFDADPNIITSPRETFARCLVDLVRTVELPTLSLDYYRRRLENRTQAQLTTSPVIDELSRL